MKKSSDSMISENPDENQLNLLYLINEVNSWKTIQGMMMLRQSVFLLSKNKQFTYNDFNSTRYGDVFSEMLQNDIDRLLKNGLIETKVEAGPYTRMYSLIITDKGKKFLNQKRISINSYIQRLTYIPYISGLVKMWINSIPQKKALAINLFLYDLHKHAKSEEKLHGKNSFEYYEKISDELKNSVECYEKISDKLKNNFEFSRPTLKKLYLFDWAKIPGNDDEKLIEILTQNFGIDWVKTAEIKKSDDSKTIQVTNEEKSLYLRLSDDKTKVNLEIDDGRTEEFTVKTKNGELNIYQRGKWGKSFLSNPVDKDCNLFYVTWFPLGALHFMQMQKDIRRQSPCTFERGALQTINGSSDPYSSKIIKHPASLVFRTKDVHIEYVLNSAHGYVGVELHSCGIMVCGVCVDSLNKDIVDDLRQICNEHIFSIMSEIQIDLMVYSQGSGIQKTLYPTGYAFALCGNDLFNDLSKKSTKCDYVLNHQSIMCAKVNAPADVKNLIFYQSVNGSLNAIINELFDIILVIWKYDLEKLNVLLETANRKKLKLIQNKIRKINKDLVDVHLLIKYLLDVVKWQDETERNISKKKLCDVDISQTYQLLQLKLNDLVSILESSIEYHNRINELINARYEEIITEYEESRNNSLNILNILISGVFAYPIVVSVIPYAGTLLHIGWTVGICIAGYMLYRFGVGIMLLKQRDNQ